MYLLAFAVLCFGWGEARLFAQFPGQPALQIPMTLPQPPNSSAFELPAPQPRGSGALAPQSASPQSTNPQHGSLVPMQSIPLQPGYSDPDNRVQLQSHIDTVTLVTREAPLSTVLSMIAQQQGLNIVTGEEVNQRITVTLTGVRLNDALDAILNVHGYTWARQNNIITIASMGSERKTSPMVQGRVVRVFTLNYVLAADVEKVVRGLMSPLGQTFTNKVTVDEQRNAHEQIVIEDLPSYIDRIAEYISQVDIMPRQVVVEANILQVTLRDNNKHGVNFNQLARVSNANVTFGTMGLASGTPPATMMRVEGSDLTGLIDLLKSTNDTKTLASPKVSVVNGQKARISVGGEIGYLLTTATPTSTLQSVEFLKFGVELAVTPIIMEDGQVLLTVGPQVSTGRINPTSKLPEKELTEVQTTALLSDGQAIVIGGLIKETSNDGQNKIPFLGDLWVVGRLFQSRDRLKERNEIIITLLPRIAQPGESCSFASDEDYAQATTPLLDRNLTPVDRRVWEGELPDAGRKPRSWNIFSRKKANDTVPISAVPVQGRFESSNTPTTLTPIQPLAYPPMPSQGTQPPQSDFSPIYGSPMPYQSATMAPTGRY